MDRILTLDHLLSRSIQNQSNAAEVRSYFGYPSRVVPCTNDPGSCAYLDTVYHSQTLSMLYTFILWAVIGGVLFIWCLGRHLVPSKQRIVTPSEEDIRSPNPERGIHRLCRSIGATLRGILLPESYPIVFGHATQLQVLILAVVTIYLVIFTFVGITYQRWVTPVKGLPGVYSIRTGLGPWSDRIGVLAYALTPLSVLLSSRESLLSLLTGIPYLRFNFLHRWLGYIILFQGTAHTIGWTIVEMRLYQPQPKTWHELMAQTSMVWGVVAMVLIWIMVFLSWPFVRKYTGYELFRKSHYVLAMLYVGACWGHWAMLSCWMIASLVVWLVDRGVRLARTFYLHYYGLHESNSGTLGFRPATATLSIFRDTDNSEVVRLDFDHSYATWEPGQHFYLCFPELSIWQSHPFTPCSIQKHAHVVRNHTYIFRVCNGVTSQLAKQVPMKLDHPMPTSDNSDTEVTTLVVLTGPYGRKLTSYLEASSRKNILLVAGGTGVTFILPLLDFLLRQPKVNGSARLIEFVWVIRFKSDLLWVKSELEELAMLAKASNAAIRIFVTRGQKDPQDEPEKMDSIQDTIHETGSDKEISIVAAKQESNTLPSLSPESSGQRPDLSRILGDFVSSTIAGPTCVVCSGPAGMISDMRSAVASKNAGLKVWKGQERYDIDMISDDRMEW
ncbi:ferric-chelate reductase [Xylogone sp. PMI_703]|nr:ferric-chelate reductase [Xylogone sp. PMI_703]